METLFGVPIGTLTAVLTAIFLIGAALFAVLALRNRVMFTVALRNIPRRRAQSLLIVVGLMLATVLFSASFGTGDTLAHSIRTLALERIGMVDVLVFPGSSQDEGEYVSGDTLAEVEAALEGQRVAGIMGVAATPRCCALPEQQPQRTPRCRLWVRPQSRGWIRCLADRRGRCTRCRCAGRRRCVHQCRGCRWIGSGGRGQTAILLQRHPYNRQCCRCL